MGKLTSPKSADLRSPNDANDVAVSLVAVHTDASPQTGDLKVHLAGFFACPAYLFLVSCVIVTARGIFKPYTNSQLYLPPPEAHSLRGVECDF